MDERQLRRMAAASRSNSSSPSLGMGGAFVLINALSTHIYRLIEDTSNTIIDGYKRGGVLGLVRSQDFVVLLRRYALLISAAWTFERLRYLWNFVNMFGGITQYLYLDATLKPGDQAYEWILCFWEHSGAFKKRSRNFQVETGPKGKGRQARMMGTASEVSIWGGGGMGRDGSNGADGRGEDEVATRLSPRDNSEQYIWFRGTLFRFHRWTRMSTGEHMWGGAATEQSMISVRSYSITRKPFFRLLEEAKKTYERYKPQMVTIRVLDHTRGTWRKVAYRHRRPLTSVIMDESKKEALLHDAREFLSSEAWYNKRGIAWKRGYMLTGPPGTGKSSTIQAIASEVKLDVYVLAINSPSMNDGILQAAFRSVPQKSILVLEDVDALAFEKRDLDTLNAASYQRVVGPPGLRPGMMGMHGLRPGSQLSLSALLNCIDGIEGNEGRLLFMTTNALSSLDPALTRPGRVDLSIEYRKATSEQARELFYIFYDPSSSSSATMTEDILDSQDSARGPVASSLKEQGKETEGRSSKPSQPFELPLEITEEDVRRWAAEWASQIPDEAFSIAELQGMLLSYKKDPEGAARDAAEWVRLELEKKREQAREAQESEERKKRLNERQQRGGGGDEDEEEAASSAAVAPKNALTRSSAAMPGGMKSVSEGAAIAETEQPRTLQADIHKMGSRLGLADPSQRKDEPAHLVRHISEAVPTE